MLYSMAGLFEYLTDRKEKDILLGFEWKYTVLQSFWNNEKMKEVLETTHIEQLETYMKKGIVYNNTSSEVGSSMRSNNKKQRSGNDFQVEVVQR